MTIHPHQTAEFLGRYIARPGASRVEIEVVRVLGGMFAMVEYWQPHFPEAFRLPDSGGKFLIHFLGVPGERGQGHLGNCHRQVDIQKVLELKEI